MIGPADERQDARDSLPVRRSAPVPSWTRRLVAGVLIGLVSTGCAGTAFVTPDGGRPAPARRLAERGVDALAAGDHARATESFNHALKLDAENPTLHLLNGLSHHTAYRAGARGRGEMAETGYLVALKQDPSSWHAAYQLGVLYLDMRRYTAAQSRLAQAARIAEDDADVYYALATGSYYARDLEPALWAARRALALAPDRPEFVQAGAMIASAAGLGDDATRYLARYRALEPDAARYTRIARRVSQWARTHELAQAAPPSSPPGPSPMTPPSPGPGPSPTDPTALGSMPGAPPPRMPVALSWSDCVQLLTPPSPQQSQQSSSSYSSSSYPSSSSYGAPPSADETTPLPALPSPCLGMPLPRMALVDITIVRTEESRTTHQGVNLLESLSVVLGGNANRTQTDITTLTNRVPTTISTLTNVFASSFGLPAAGITYALDIANTADTRVEIIARPTLISLDRTPSNFFSGSNITIALAGQYGGTVQEKPVGVSLSVTPTFLDDDSMLLTVKATARRSRPACAGRSTRRSTRAATRSTPACS